MVDHLDGRRRVVDGRRERADRDVDEDPQREGRVLVDRPLDPEREPAGETPLGDPRERPPSRAPRAARRPRRRSRRRRGASRSRRRGASPRRADPRRRSPGARPTRLLRTTSVGSRARIASSSASAPERRRVLASSTVARSASRPECAASAATLTGRRRWREAVEEDEEEHEADAEQEPSHRHSEVRDGLVDPAEQRVREHERTHEHGERRLEDAVPVPEPHVARRERSGRHLHDEHAHRHHEPGQPDGRADDGCQHGQRSLRRVVPARRHVRRPLEPNARVAENEPGEPAEQRDAPTGCPSGSAERERPGPSSWGRSVRDTSVAVLRRPDRHHSRTGTGTCRVRHYAG